MSCTYTMIGLSNVLGHGNLLVKLKQLKLPIDYMQWIGGGMGSGNGGRGFAVYEAYDKAGKDVFLNKIEVSYYADPRGRGFTRFKGRYAGDDDDAATAFSEETSTSHIECTPANAEDINPVAPETRFTHIDYR
jgi:hypothetical protein